MRKTIYIGMPLDEMAVVGYTEDRGILFTAHSDDNGNIPHFHFRDLSCSDREIKRVEQMGR